MNKGRIPKLVLTRKLIEKERMRGQKNYSGDSRKIETKSMKCNCYYALGRRGLLKYAFPTK